MHRALVLNLILILSVSSLYGCGSDALTAGQQALAQGDHLEAVAKLRQAQQESGSNPDVAKLYEKALVSYRDTLRQPGVSGTDCDAAVEQLSSISGFAEEGGSASEVDLLTQALLCAARDRARNDRTDEAVSVIIKGMERLPGFSPGSPVLAKALLDTAHKAARAGKVNETTALAQIIFSAGDHGLSLSLLDLLETAGASANDIGKVLSERAGRAKSSDAATGLAAGFATWHGRAGDAARWYDEIAARASKDQGATAKAMKRYATLRSEESARLTENKANTCQPIAERVLIGGGSSEIPSIAAAPTPDGVIVAWIEGTKVPQQGLKIVRLGLDGAPGKAVVVANPMPRVQKSASGDVRDAYAPKNREPALGMIRCGETIEIAARGAPECAWSRATLADNGSVSSKLTPMPPLSETAQMPREDVWWNVACANSKLVHIWLADTQLMRLAWLENGVSVGEPSNIRLPGFAPWFVATGKEENATFLAWIDIMGEDSSQILNITIPEDGTVPVDEETSYVTAEPLVERIDSRVEQMRLSPVGSAMALTYYPKRQDIMVRWLEADGSSRGAPTPLVHLRTDEQRLRFDAAGAGERLGVIWTESLTDKWSALFFQSFTNSGSSFPQRVAGLVRPEVSPVVVGTGDVFAVIWIDRADEAGSETLRASLLRCAGAQ